MLKNLIKNGYGKKEKLNCAQKILYGANEVYNLGLNEDTLKLSKGFGGGMSIESTCGALTASVIVISKLFIDKDDQIINITKEMLNSYRSDMGDIDCAPLKQNYRTIFSGCDKVVIKAAEHLDIIFEREFNNY